MIIPVLLAVSADARTRTHTRQRHVDACISAAPPPPLAHRSQLWRADPPLRHASSTASDTWSHSLSARLSSATANCTRTHPGDRPRQPLRRSAHERVRERVAHALTHQRREKALHRHFYAARGNARDHTARALGGRTSHATPRALTTQHRRRHNEMQRSANDSQREPRHTFDDSRRANLGAEHLQSRYFMSLALCTANKLWRTLLEMPSQHATSWFSAAGSRPLTASFDCAQTANR